VSNDGSIGGATPSHQQETQDINTKLWGSGEGSEGPGQFTLPVPPCLEASTRTAEEHDGAMSGVEEGAIHQGSDNKTGTS